MFDRRERRTLFTQNKHGGTYIFRLHGDSRANIVVNHLLDKGSKASSCKCYVPRRDLLFTYVQHKAMVRERFSSRLRSPPTVCLDRSQIRLVTTNNVAKKKASTFDTFGYKAHSQRLVF